MKRIWISLLFFGFCVGVTIGVFVNLIISAAIGGGTYYAVMPQLRAWFPTETGAVAVFLLWLGAIGAAFALASQIFDISRWSALRQYLTHFLVTGVIYIPFLWICYLPYRLSSVFLMFGNILLSYGISWICQYRANRRRIAHINEALEKRRHHDGN